MTKNAITSRAISGQYLDPRDVLSTSRDRRVLTLRHVWDDSTDGRVLSCLKRTWMSHARDLASLHGREVEVYSKDGSMLDQVSPSSVGQDRHDERGDLSRGQIRRDINHVLRR